MVGFYWRVVRRTPLVFVQSLLRLDAGSSVLTIIFAAVGVATWQQHLPSWAPYAAFGIILVYGFLQATYEESQREAANTAFDASKLKAYESRDTATSFLNCCQAGISRISLRRREIRKVMSNAWCLTTESTSVFLAPEKPSASAL